MSDIVNCGVIGAGWWSTTAHLPALREHPKARLVAVQKRDLVDVVLGNAVNHSPGDLGAYAMRIIEASCESARSGENVKLG